jgi:prepilin-type N-terminal cleavage/methylation domain-containing protein
MIAMITVRSINLQRTAPGGVKSSMNLGRAFTLVELLMVIAIIAILGAMLIPALPAAKARAQRMACVGNLKQFGAGIFIYAGDYGDRLPGSKYNPQLSPTGGGDSSCFLYEGSGVTGMPVDPAVTPPTNHGLLYSTAIMAKDVSFYCPGHTADLGIQFDYESYVTTANAKWPAYSPAYATAGTTIGARVRSGYAYYPQTGQTLGATPASGYVVAQKAAELSPVRPMLTDIIYEWSEITHRTAGHAPAGINVVWGDGHAGTCTSPAALDPGGDHWNALAGLGAGPGEPGMDSNFLAIMAALQP